VEDTTEAAMNTFDRLKVDIDSEDIDRSHRLGPIKTNGTLDERSPKPKPRPIIVKFVSYAKRNLVFTNKKELKKTGKTITESLTKRRMDLLRAASANERVKTAWTTDGKVICLLPNDKIVVLTTHKDLRKLD
jgi:hypothetical protein